MVLRDLQFFKVAGLKKRLNKKKDLFEKRDFNPDTQMTLLYFIFYKLKETLHFSII